MEEVLKFLNTNSGALNVLFTAVVTVATAVYAMLTWKLVSETRLMREVQTEPKLSVTLQSIDEAAHIVRLHFKNAGLGPALRVRFSPRAESGEGAAKLLEEFVQPEFFKRGVSYLGPGQERISMYTQLHQDGELKLSSVLAFDVTYESVTKKIYHETLVVDMSEYRGGYQLGKPHLYAMAQSLERIEEHLRKLVGGSRLKADIYTEEDRSRERLKREEDRATQRRNTDALYLPDGSSEVTGKSE